MSKKIRIQIAGVHAEVHYDLKGVQTVKNLDLPVQSFSRYHYEHLTKLPILDYTHVKPVLLIRHDNAHLGWPQNIVKKETTQPVAINTKLGWLAYGPGQHFVETETKRQDLVIEFVESENFEFNNFPPIEPVDDTRAKKLLTETTLRFGKHFAIG